MNLFFKKFVLVVTVAVMIGFSFLVPKISIAGESFAILSGQSGEGFCSVDQNGSMVEAEIQVLNMTPGSMATAWVIFSNSDIRHLDATLSDYTGEAVFKGSFTVPFRARNYTIEVRDHNKSIFMMRNNTQLNSEFMEIENAVARNVTEMGTCVFPNRMRVRSIRSIEVEKRTRDEDENDDDDDDDDDDD